MRFGGPCLWVDPRELDPGSFVGINAWNVDDAGGTSGHFDDLSDMGAWRMSKSQVLTRHTYAVETLGAATVLCTDKTGTLTLNKMQLAVLYAKGKFHDVVAEKSVKLAEEAHELIELGILASQSDPFDPIEKAIKQVGTVHLEGTEHIHHNWTLVKEYPLSKDLIVMSHVWEAPDHEQFVVAAKGSPERSSSFVILLRRIGKH